MARRDTHAHALGKKSRFKMNLFARTTLYSFNRSVYTQTINFNEICTEIYKKIKIIVKMGTI